MVEAKKANAGTEPLIRNVSDTALWVAVYRARETERKDALFHDPYARKLAGERGEQIAKASPAKASPDWPYVARTVRFDQIVSDQVRQGTEMIINLAAGLDTRPYRMQLPSSLQWVEIDLPQMIDYKEEILGGEKPQCGLERVRLDLADVPARRELFSSLGKRGRKALVLAEGLLAYLSPEEVLALGRDLGEQQTFRDWAVDLASPGLLEMLQKNLKQLSEAGSPLKFGPAEGPDFFIPCGWKPAEVYSVMKTAAQIKRLPLWMRLFALFPESNGRQGKRPWGGIVRLTRSS